MKNIYLFIFASFLALGFVSCSDNDPDGAEIFPTTSPDRDSLDLWLLKNYTYPYNVRVEYKMKDIYSDMSYNLVPADSAKSAKLMRIAKYLWFDAYAETMGSDFVKSNVPRIIHLIGSPAYNSGNHTEVLGTAEGGLMITLYNVNGLTDEMLADYPTMNTYYFHTMHHEFTHILNQKKPYSDNFQLISEGSYVSGDWYLKDSQTAHEAGFVTPYAMSEPLEDFAEMMSTYVTTPPEEWDKIIQDAGTTGAPIINAKLEMVRSYMRESWHLDIDNLRNIVLRRASELKEIDLNHLN